MYINLDLECPNIYYQLDRRKDGQWRFRLGNGFDFEEPVMILTRLSTYDEMFRLAHVVNTLRTYKISDIRLVAKSLLGMRADQIEENGGIDLIRRVLRVFLE